MSSADITDDVTQDARWVTFDQLAEARRISRASAIRLVRRKKAQWRRQKDNRGNVTVLVPGHELQPSPDSPPVSPDDSHPDSPSVITALREAFHTTLQAKDSEIAAKDSLISELRVSLDQARAEAQEAKSAVMRAELGASVAKERLGQMEAAEQVRKARGRWARILEAARGR